jgi:ectoine hydroxylase-related dioxygenase (phytanoyl-CoA dioxygenase family)
VITIPRIAPTSRARAVVRKVHPQRALTRLGLSAETYGTPKVVRSLLLNAAGLQAMRALLARFLHRRRTRNGSTSALVATLAEEGIVVIPEFLPVPLFDAVRAEFRRALEHASTLRLEKTVTSHVAVQYEDSSKRVGRFEEGVIDHDYVTVMPHDSDFPMIREHLLKNERLLGLIREVSGLSRVFSPRGDLDRLYLSNRAVSDDPQTELHEDIFCHDWRAWFTINAWTEENGAFTYAPRSHHLSLSRLALEYWNSVTNTRDGGSWRLGPGAKRWLGIAARSICCPPNSLVLADTCGYHARGAFQQGRIREAIQMSFRLNPWRTRG